MAANINRVVLSGNLTKDPELRYTPGGDPVCEMRLAVNGRQKVGGTWQDRADYFDIVVWGNQGEACAQHLHRGSPVGIDGKLRFEEWEHQGSKRSRVRIVADNVQFLGGGDRQGDGGGNRFVSAGARDDTGAVDFGADTGADADFTSADDDIPF